MKTSVDIFSKSSNLYILKWGSVERLLTNISPVSDNFSNRFSLDKNVLFLTVVKLTASHSKGGLLLKQL